jgi:hypothetical protein
MAVEIRHADHVAPYIRKELALTSLTSGGRSIDIVRLRTQATEKKKDEMLCSLVKVNPKPFLLSRPSPTIGALLISPPPPQFSADQCTAPLLIVQDLHEWLFLGPIIITFLLSSVGSPCFSQWAKQN